jgi:hypothetical protein
MNKRIPKIKGVKNFLKYILLNKMFIEKLYERKKKKGKWSIASCRRAHGGGPHWDTAAGGRGRGEALAPRAR